MDRTQLVEATRENAAGNGDGPGPTADEVERVLDSVFGTVEHPGSIAEALSRGEEVVLGSFGRFRPDGGTAAFRPGKALTEFLHGETG
ncbi:hypothetical protein ABZ690_34500 [Streptomyces sp. NPDC006967]|uniref:HU family DNA-binding protein n=1 Tax=unclassified Streptomyces TaxID=2593676 RepID=UPI000CD55E13|nr:hypothetical protein [Streptomyces sp. SM1]